MKMIIKICRRIINIFKIKYAILKKRNKKNATKWAIIGLGNMADNFANSINLSPNAKLIAVASRSLSKAKKFANKHSVSNYYGNYQDMLADGGLSIDIVYIATPIDFHYEQIKMCFEYNKNVICEKPITTSSKELIELINIAKNKSLFFMEAMWLKTLPTFLKAQQLIEDNIIGDIKYIRIDLSKFEVSKKYQNSLYKGVLYDYGIYPIVFAYSILKNNVTVEYVRDNLKQSGIDKDWTICIKNESTNVTINISSIYSGSKSALIYGTDGTIEFPSQFNRTNKIKTYGIDGIIKNVYKFKYLNDGYLYEIEEVNRCIKLGILESSLVSINESLNVIVLMEKLMNNYLSK